MPAIMSPTIPGTRIFLKTIGAKSTISKIRVKISTGLVKGREGNSMLNKGIRSSIRKVNNSESSKTA
jgi:hypothetical protein